MIVAVASYSWLLPKIWNPERGVTNEPFDDDSVDRPNPPGFLLSLLPILTPVVLILMGTTWSMVAESDPPTWLVFVGDKAVALLAGVLVAYLVAVKSMNREERDESANKGVVNAGIVLLVTGAAGAYGAVINEAGVSNTIATAVEGLGGNHLLALAVCFGVGAAFRVAVGSGTVASITTMTIMASVAPAIGIHPVWVAMACLAGALCLGHINDSGFWVTAKLPGFSMTGGLKTYTVAQTITGVFVFMLVLIGSTLLPMPQ